MASGDFAVHAELLAAAEEQQRVTAAAEEQQRVTARSHRLSRVPVHLREKNANDYTPGFVAIGPLHNREHRRLRPAERLKATYLNGLISRGHPDQANHLAVIEEYVRIVAAREEEARAMYVDEVVADIGADDFIQMMVLDGCFIIEHLVNVATGREESGLHATPFGPAQLSVDLVLVLAENQIPFFVLVDLITASRLPEFDVTGYPPPVLLVKLVLFYLAGEKGRDLSEELPVADQVSHVLHLLHEMITKARTQWESQPPFLARGWAHAAMRRLHRLPSLILVPLLYQIVPEGHGRRARADVPSASDLKGMRVQFSKTYVRGGSTPVVGIASVMGPVPLAVKLRHEEDQLQLPQLRLEFRTRPLLLNLVAFEQSSRVSQDVSSYVAFMAKLVQSAEDAGVLSAAEVVQLQGGVGNEGMGEVARFFQAVGRTTEAAATLQTSYLSVTVKLLRERSQRWANMERNYFKLLAELVALVTFVSSVSTIFQTYAAFKYH